MRIMLSSSSNSVAASARASSVLPTPVGTEEEEGADGALGVLDAGPGADHRVGHRAHRLVLADDALVQLLLEPEELLHLPFHQLRDRDARPPRDDLGDVLLVDLFLDHPPPARGRRARFLFPQLLLERGEGAVLQLGHAVQVVGARRLLDLDLHLLDALAELARPLDGRLLLLPLLAHRLGLGLQARQLLLELLQAVPRRGVGLLLQRLALDLELQDAPRDLVELGGHRVDLGPEPRRRLVDEVDRLVGQEPVGDVAVGEHGGRHQRRVLDADAVMDLVALPEPAEDRDRVFHRRLVHHDGLEPALERRVLLDVLLVLVERRRADAVQLAARQRGLQQVGRVHGALGGARADHGVQLVDEEDDLALRVLDGLEHGLEPLLELAAVLRAGDERAHVERHDALALEAFGHVAPHDALGQALHDRRLADAGRADQHGIVLGAAREDLDHAADLLVAADDRVELALLGERGEIAPVLLERLVGALGRLARHALAAPDGGQGLEQLVLGEAGGAERLRHRAVLELGERQEQVLDAHELVLHAAAPAASAPVSTSFTRGEM